MRFDLPSISMKKLSVTKLIGEIFSATMTATTDDSHMNRLSSQPSPSKISNEIFKRDSRGDHSHTVKPMMEENYAVIRNPTTRRYLVYL